uniref:Putative nuclease HARBI1 n=1 Tax=Gadus morhua TaxID=8049 RepID=A0A8C5AJ18_GADMO
SLPRQPACEYDVYLYVKGRLLLIDPNDVLRFGDTTLISRYRLPRAMILGLAEELRPFLERPTRRHGALPVVVQLTNALRLFAKGDFQSEVADIGKLSQPAVSRYLTEVAKAIGGLARRYIKFPTGDELNIIKEAFYEHARMPGVIGLVDGSLFPIKAPKEDEATYVCRKGYHAINIQAIGDHNMLIRHLVAKWPGSSHDAFVFNTSGLSGWLLGDSGYLLKPFLLTPVANERTPQDMRYNQAHKKCRARVELKGLCMVWRCHDMSGGYLQYTPEKVVLFIKATAVLHNICRLANLPDPDIPDQDMEHPEEAQDVHYNGINTRIRLILDFF